MNKLQKEIVLFAGCVAIIRLLIPPTVEITVGVSRYSGGREVAVTSWSTLALHLAALLIGTAVLLMLAQSKPPATKVWNLKQRLMVGIFSACSVLLGLVIGSEAIPAFFSGRSMPDDTDSVVICWVGLVVAARLSVGLFADGQRADLGCHPKSDSPESESIQD